MSVSIWNTSDINLSYFDPKDLKYLNKVSLKEKLIRTFFRAFFFKSLFRIARSLDKYANIHKILNLQSIIDIFLNKKNFSYAFYFLMISTLFKIYRFLVTTYFDKNWFEETYEAQEKLNYKMINLICGILISVFGVYLGKGSNIIFYTVLYYWIKNFLFYFIFKMDMINFNKKQESKKLLYLGFAGGFLSITLFDKNLRNSLSLTKYFS
jgi:hypothetical protein